LASSILDHFGRQSWQMAKVARGLLCAQQVDAKLRHQSLEPRDFRETCGDIGPESVHPAIHRV
jgi:hypothetical protein